MTLFEKYGRNLPEYYGAMYLDGYTPDQILHAAKKELIHTHEEKRIDASVEKQLQEAIHSAMKDLFKDWK